MNIAEVDLTSTPPRIDVPRDYNAAVEFIDANIEAGRGERVAIIDHAGEHTYAALAERVDRAGAALLGLGLAPESRVLMCMLDTADFVAVFWGAIKAGLVPVPVNTLLTDDDYRYMLSDCRARALVVSTPLLARFDPWVNEVRSLEHVLVSGDDAGPYRALDDVLASAPPRLEPAATCADEAAFWLYTSGSTGTPKGSVHLHRDLVYTAATYGCAVLGIEADDRVFSAAKLFFAYGLGNGMTFPLYVGATAVLLADRPTPDSVMSTLAEHQPTIYYGVPTLYGAILADPTNTREKGSARLRRCVSAGEALPEELARGWKERFAVEILDGIGSTEMLHIFLSNRPGDVRYATTGKAVPGYELRLVGEDGEAVGPGEIGELWVSGGSSAVCYWNQRAKSLATFQGPWTRTGDKYVVDAQGYYQYCGRTDDMLKVSGQWVSPFEVESALMAHDSVLEAAVVGHADADDLIKPKAFIVPKEGVAPDDALADALKAFVKERLAPFKYPRWIAFAPALPKTATGKIQRFKLRD